RLVQDDEHVPGVNPLERRLVVVGRLTPERHQLPAQVPLGLIHPAGQLPGRVHPPDVPPQDRPHLRVGRRAGDDERGAGLVRVQPPRRHRRRDVGFADAVAAADCGAAVIPHRLHDLPLLRPHHLPEPALHPARRIPDVRARPESGGGGRPHAHTTTPKPTWENRVSHNLPAGRAAVSAPLTPPTSPTRPPPTPAPAPPARRDPTAPARRRSPPPPSAPAPP